VLQHVVQRLEPFAGLERLQFAGVTWCRVPHSLTGLSS
jgi:hypothetical protein